MCIVMIKTNEELNKKFVWEGKLSRKLDLYSISSVELLTSMIEYSYLTTNDFNTSNY